MSNLINHATRKLELAQQNDFTLEFEGRSVQFRLLENGQLLFRGRLTWYHAFVPGRGIPLKATDSTKEDVARSWCEKLFKNPSKADHGNLRK